MLAITPCSVERSGRRVRGFMLKCSRCNVTGREPVNTLRGHDDNEQEARLIARKFEASGWRVNHKTNKHVCPDCVREGRAKQMAYLHANKENMPVKTEAAKPVPGNVVGLVTKPRECSRQDRRIIFAKLEECYADEKVGYASGWSDQKVADDLGVPVAWVRDVRAENFGEVASNPEISDWLFQAAEWKREATRLANSIELFITESRRLKESCDQLVARGEFVERKMADIQKIVGAK